MTPTQHIAPTLRRPFQSWPAHSLLELIESLESEMRKLEARIAKAEQGLYRCRLAQWNLDFNALEARKSMAQDALAGAY